MKWFAIVGVVLFLGVAVAPSINANIGKTSLEPTAEMIEDDELIESISKLLEVIPSKEEFENSKISISHLYILHNEIHNIFKNDRYLNRYVENIPDNVCVAMKEKQH